MWACKVVSFLFYPEIPSVLGSCGTWPVFLCIYLGFFPCCFLLVLSKGLPCVSWTLLLPAVVFPTPSLGGWSGGSGSTICAPMPSWPCPHSPLSRGATCAPSSPSFTPCGTGQLLWICSGLGLAGFAGAHVPAQHVTGKQMNLGSTCLLGQGAMGSPHLPLCVWGLLLGCSSHPRWPCRGVYQARSPRTPNLINKVGCLLVPGHAQTPGRFPSPTVPLRLPHPPWVHHRCVPASTRAAVPWRPQRMQQHWAAVAAPEQIP